MPLGGIGMRREARNRDDPNGLDDVDLVGSIASPHVGQIVLGRSLIA